MTNPPNPRGGTNGVDKRGLDVSAEPDRAGSAALKSRIDAARSISQGQAVGAPSTAPAGSMPA